jgi:hypothetical protein
MECKKIKEMKQMLITYFKIIDSGFKYQCYTDITEFKNKLTEFKERKVQEQNAFVEPLNKKMEILGFIFPLEIEEYNYRYKQMIKLEKFTRTKDEYLQFLMNKDYPTLLKEKHRLNTSLRCRNYNIAI